MRAPRPARAGMLMAVAAVLVLVIAAGTTMLQQVSRQRHLEAHRAVWSEVAMNLAESGMNLALEGLRETGETPGTLWASLLLESDAAAPGSDPIPLDADVLHELAAGLDGEAEVEVTAALRDARGLDPGGGGRGLVPDPREKEGELELRARGTYRGLTRTLVASRRVRVVRVTAPALSKFTLFLATLDGQDPNLLAHPFGASDAALTADGRPASPLVLHHRKDRTPAVVDGRYASLAASFADPPPDVEGLVHLGGPEPWVLNLMHGLGAGTYEEGFQLRRTRYRMASRLPGVAGEEGLYFGFYSGVLARPPMVGATGSDRSSVLHLFGDVDDVSPTAVLGPVFRRYLRVGLLDGLWYPPMDEREFATWSGAGGFPGGYREYARVMAQVVVDAYNRSVDFIATNTETLQEGGLVSAAGTPFVPRSRLLPAALARLGPDQEGDPAFLYPRAGQVQEGSVRLGRPMAGGPAEEVFRGCLSDLDGTLLEDTLSRRVTASFQDGPELLARCLVEGGLDTGGVVRVRRGDLELPALTTRAGSMILVEGNIVIGGPIARDGAGPLTLVALNGDIRVETGEPVVAALVALRGRVLAAKGLALTGALAARTLDLRGLAAGAVRKTIVYDETLDPTREDSYWKQFRVWLSPLVRMQVEGS